MYTSIANYDFENLVDDGIKFVIAELDRQLSIYPKEICQCNDCVVDMAAMALNALPPKYRCSLLGSIYQAGGKDDPVYASQLKHAVAVAIEQVSSNPGHE